MNRFQMLLSLPTCAATRRWSWRAATWAVEKRPRRRQVLPFILVQYVYSSTHGVNNVEVLKGGLTSMFLQFFSAKARLLLLATSQDVI